MLNSQRDSSEAHDSDRLLVVVLDAAKAHAERLRWLGYREQVRAADEIDAAVERLRGWVGP